MSKHKYIPTEYIDELGVYGPNTVRKTVVRFVQQLHIKNISVSSEALTHNFVCWIHGWSSGFVDKANAVFVETKKSLGGLRFDITDLDQAKNARTYIA